jgi:hypothetical protein
MEMVGGGVRHRRECVACPRTPTPLPPNHCFAELDVGCGLRRSTVRYAGVATPANGVSIETGDAAEEGPAGG